MRNSRKPMAAALALALVAALGIGGTIAWLTDSSGPVTNTFTVGKVDIELYEHDYDPATGALDEGEQVTSEADYKMIPGTVLPKDPTVVIKAGSEDCWVFVKVDESANLDSYIAYGIAEGWTQLAGVDGVYCLKQAATTVDVEYGVLASDQVSVPQSVTKDMMDALRDAGAEAWPKLTFTAYACQLYETNGHEFTAAEAWDKVNPAA